MLCVIEPAMRCVWGLGATAAEAWSDARKEIDCYKSWNRDSVIGPLELARLRKDANLDTDGESLWHWVEYQAPVQDSLFGGQ